MEESTHLVNATVAAQITGYLDEAGKPSPARFRNAVKRGTMPKAFDKRARPQLWSRAALAAKTAAAAAITPDEEKVRALDERLNLG